jgi:Gpi18-like mannosyltransferase
MSAALPAPPVFIALGILLIGIAMRAPFLNALTSDTDLYVLAWYEHLAAAGFSALGENIPNRLGELTANYTPPYFYLLYFVSRLDGLVPSLWLIKSISIAFDCLGAFFAYKIMRLHFSPTRALIVGACVFLAPTVIANGAWWGQCDTIWASLLLGSLYFILARKPALGLLFFGLAFAFKAQAIFFSPFLLMLLLRGEIRWWHFGIPAFAYIALMIPAVMFGQTWEHVLTVYLQQASHFQFLSLSAPNLYYFVPDSLYAIGTAVGLAITVITSAALAYLPRHTNAPMEDATRVLGAAMFVALSVFLLPKMHDRYFFGADVFTILLAGFLPRLWIVAATFQVSSLSAYVPIIYQSLTGEARDPTLPMAVALNTVIVALLVLQYWRACTRPQAGLGGAAQHATIAAAALVLGQIMWFAGAVARDVLVSQFCPAQSGLSAFLCAQDMPFNVTYGTWRHWALYLLIMALAYVLMRRVLPRVLALARIGSTGQSNKLPAG